MESGDPNEVYIPSLGDGPCVDYPEPDIFTPENQRADDPKNRLAKLICKTCLPEVQELCLEEGERLGDYNTIRAGLMPYEQKRRNGKSRRKK